MGKGTSQLPVDVTINNGLVELVDQFKFWEGFYHSTLTRLQKWQHAEDKGWGPSPNLSAFGATST